MEEKKGVSPLIATVLLIGLVVVIAMIIFFWYGNYLEDVLEKQGIDLESSCAQDVEIYLPSDEIECVLSGENSVVNLYIENVGNTEIKGLNVIYSSDTLFDSVLKSQIVHQAVGTYIQVNLGQDITGQSLDLEIVPIVGSSTSTRHCENVAEYVSLFCNS